MSPGPLPRSACGPGYEAREIGGPFERAALVREHVHEIVTLICAVL